MDANTLAEVEFLSSPFHYLDVHILSLEFLVPPIQQYYIFKKVIYQKMSYLSLIQNF